MPRKPQFLTADFPYHVTARANNKEWFYIPTPAVWSIMSGILEIVSNEYSARVLSFVLMANHFHMLIQTPLANLDGIMNYFMREVSRAIARQAGRINHVFGGRNKPTLIRDSRYFAHVYKYVYRNPVRPRIAERPELYHYSTLPILIKGGRAPFPIHDLDGPLSELVPRPWNERLEWLNNPLPKEQDDLIRKALRRVDFQFSKSHDYQRLVAALMTKPS